VSPLKFLSVCSRYVIYARAVNPPMSNVNLGYGVLKSKILINSLIYAQFNPYQVSSYSIQTAHNSNVLFVFHWSKALGHVCCYNWEALKFFVLELPEFQYLFAGYFKSINFKLMNYAPIHDKLLNDIL